MANRTIQDVCVTLDPVTISIGAYYETIKFVVGPLKYEIIFAKFWKTKYKPSIDCASNVINIWHREKLYVITSRASIEDISLNATVNNYDHGCPMFSVII